LQNSRKCALMLKASISALHAQRRHVHGNKAYQAAYRAGIRYRQNLYGEELFWQGLHAARTGRWTDVSLCFGTLMKYHPHGLLHPLMQKLSHVFSNPADARAS
jgi:hypothetical protein